MSIKRLTDKQLTAHVAMCQADYAAVKEAGRLGLVTRCHLAVALELQALRQALKRRQRAA